MRKFSLSAVLVLIAFCSASHAGPATAETRTDSSGAPVGAAGAPAVPPEYQEEFKGVIAGSAIPPEDASFSCPEFKEGMKKDEDRIMQTMKGLAEAKKKGELGFFETLKGIWTLKSVVWVAVRGLTAPEWCMKEYDKENEQRSQAMIDEINAMTAEVKDK